MKYYLADFQTTTHQHIIYFRSFLRGMPQLTRMMKRVQPHLGKMVPHIEGEPNFYEMDLEHPLPTTPSNPNHAYNNIPPMYVANNAYPPPPQYNPYHNPYYGHNNNMMPPHHQASQHHYPNYHGCPPPHHPLQYPPNPYNNPYEYPPQQPPYPGMNNHHSYEGAAAASQHQQHEQAGYSYDGNNAPPQQQMNDATQDHSVNNESSMPAGHEFLN